MHIPTPPPSPIHFNLTPSGRLALLLCTFVVGLVLTAAIGAALVAVMGDKNLTAAMRIGTVAQDIFMLVLPAIVTAMIATRQAPQLLALRWTRRSLPILAGGVAVLIASMPMMSRIIEWNQNLHLPQSLAGLENAIRAMEDGAAGSIDAVMGAHTGLNLLVNILIIGVLAGFSEELFFRGALQRLLASARMKPWMAIWLGAFIFSAVHMQFFGFVPRMLLGALFGYMLVWSGSVWVPMAVHTLNNILFVILQYSTGNGDVSISGTPGTVLALVSTVVTGGLLYVMYRYTKTAER